MGLLDRWRNRHAEPLAVDLSSLPWLSMSPSYDHPDVSAYQRIEGLPDATLDLNGTYEWHIAYNKAGRPYDKRTGRLVKLP